MDRPSPSFKIPARNIDIRRQYRHPENGDSTNFVCGWAVAKVIYTMITCARRVPLLSMLLCPNKLNCRLFLLERMLCCLTFPRTYGFVLLSCHGILSPEFRYRVYISNPSHSNSLYFVLKSNIARMMMIASTQC